MEFLHGHAGRPRRDREAAMVLKKAFRGMPV
jgi:hypothetical protein